MVESTIDQFRSSLNEWRALLWRSASVTRPTRTVRRGPPCTLVDRGEQFAVIGAAATESEAGSIIANEPRLHNPHWTSAIVSSMTAL